MTTSNDKARVLRVVLMLMFVPLSSGLSQEKPLRPLTPDDLFNLVEVGQVAL